MRREIDDVGSPQAWMRYAKVDLDFAKIVLTERGLYEPLCFHAQQAAEKAIKAVLIQFQVDFPPTHNLQKLVDLLPRGVARTPALIEASELSPYAVSTRYPRYEEAMDEAEYREAVRRAEAVVAWAEEVFERDSAPR